MPASQGRSGDAAMLAPAAWSGHWTRPDGSISSHRPLQCPVLRAAVVGRILRLEDVMFGRVAALIYGIASYLIFFVATVYAMAFIGSYPVPKTIDGGPESGLAGSILIDAALLGL